uniref:Uncharacterized protein n=1 Tax=Mycena chlorophos TaxID=658473 RepID=A0ABQ0L3T7_MYCCL|nr:predicted protein [Mycena chlorophos]
MYLPKTPTIDRANSADKSEGSTPLSSHPRPPHVPLRPHSTLIPPMPLNTGKQRPRFRPLSLPVSLDYRSASKRRIAEAGTVDSTLPSPVVDCASPLTPTRATYAGPPTPTRSKHTVSGSLQIAAAAVRNTLLSRPSLTPNGIPVNRPIGLPVAPSPSPRHARYHPQRAESRCCQVLMQGLFVAFEDDFVDSGVPRPEELLADGGRPFTHLISLSTRHRSLISHTTDKRSGVQRLELRLPKLYSPLPPTDEEIEERVHFARIAALERGEVFGEDEYYDVLFNSDAYVPDGFTHLEALQLISARDFLLSAALIPELHPPEQSQVRVLVTTPRDHRTDAIAAVMGYLSLVLKAPVERLLRKQNAHPKMLAIWKYTISDECATFLQQVSQI